MSQWLDCCCRLISSEGTIVVDSRCPVHGGIRPMVMTGGLDAPAPIDWQTRYQAREQRLKDLAEGWRSKADEKLNPGGGLFKHSERAIAALRSCADELRALLSEEPTV